jgi:hypothetical protein
MRTQLLLAAAAVTTAAALAPLPGASAYCDPAFFEHTGYCNSCLLVADKTHRPEPVFCPL